MIFSNNILINNNDYVDKINNSIFLDNIYNIQRYKPEKIIMAFRLYGYLLPTVLNLENSRITKDKLYIN